jgi:ATP adenylyltransferase
VSTVPAGSFSNDLTYSQFQVRYCPSLAKKPLPNQGQDAKPKKKHNPFEDPDPALFITDIPVASETPSHYLVLNKFPIIQSHFILATKINKAQTIALEAEDLEAAYACLRAWEDGSPDRQLYGFFNSGEHSGASQAHRHLQFVPVEGMRQGDDKGEWDLLMNKIVDDNASVPFEVFWEAVAPDTSAQELHAIYMRLYDKAHAAAKDFIQRNPGMLKLHEISSGEVPFSYNLGMTSKTLMILPRRSEGTSLAQNGREVGFAALNGTVLAGTMLVKKQEEWDLLKSNGSLINELLQDIGIPRTDCATKAARI